MKLKPLVLFALAVGLNIVSRILELYGDAAPLAESGVSVERAIYHIAAFISLFGSMGCLVAAGIFLFRKSSLAR